MFLFPSKFKLKFDLQSNIKRYGLAVMHTFNLGTPRQKQEDLCEF